MQGSSLSPLATQGFKVRDGKKLHPTHRFPIYIGTLGDYERQKLTSKCFTQPDLSRALADKEHTSNHTQVCLLKNEKTHSYTYFQPQTHSHYKSVDRAGHCRNMFDI